MTVGAVRFGKMMGLDAGFTFRSFGQSNEFLGKARFTALEAGPVALGADFAIGGGGGPDGRDNFTVELGFGFTLHFKEIASFSGRGYVAYYTDRMCWPRSRPAEDLNSSRSACRVYDQNQGVPGAPAPDPGAVQDVQNFASQYLNKTDPAAWDPRDNRLNGARFYLQAALEVAISQNVGAFLVIEGVPFQHDRAAYMDLWNNTQVRRDPHIYGKAGMTFKF
jgi:hypothetical protein